MYIMPLYICTIVFVIYYHCCVYYLYSICLQIERKSIYHYHMISPQESVETVYHFCQDDIANREKLVKAVKALIDNVLKQWSKRKMVADNISAVIAMFGQFIFEDNNY